MLKILDEFRNLPKFSDGRINYTDSKKAPVINCFVKYKNKFLLLKRSDKVGAYKGKWNSIGGYIDEDKPVKEKVLEEIWEELKIKKDDVKNMMGGNPYEVVDKEIGKIWIVHPFVAELKKEPAIVLDFEHTEFRWVKEEDIENYDSVPGLKEVIKRTIV